jgi:hypothetical protein
LSCILKINLQKWRGKFRYSKGRISLTKCQVLLRFSAY